MNSVAKARSGLIAAFIFLTFLFLFNPSLLHSSAKEDISELTQPHVQDASNPRIAKVSMLYGAEVNPYYVRALKSHRRHNERWNYGMHILQQDIVGGYWNKPSYLLHLIVNELAKPPAERVEWFMWVDADLVLVNPAIPLETFLPPPDFSNIQFLGNRDGKGLNSGTFFLRVSPWSVQMLAKSIGVPMFRPELDLDVQVDQTSMAVVLNEDQFHATGETLFQPRTWYNAFQFHEEVGMEWGEGNLLIHFPGLEQDRWKLMEKWLNKVERNPDTLTVPLRDTFYLKEVDDFWAMLRRAIELIERAQALMEQGKQANMEFVAESAMKIQKLIWDASIDTSPGVDLMKLYREETANLGALLDKVE